jgi:glycosyltransferase involved in cell wall biosynthesis
MRLGIAINETWSFLHEIYADLSEHHHVELFTQKTRSFPVLNERLNRVLYKRDWINFLGQNDVVFFEWASELLAYATHLPKTSGIVTRLHRYEMYQWTDQINWDAVDGIILVSDAKRREFISRYPSQTAKITVIPEAIYIERFKPVKRSLNGDIGILCNISPRKRVYELVLLFHELCKEADGFHLHIGGGKHPKFPDYYDAVHALVEKLSLSSRVTFYEHVDKPEEWYTKIDLFISNSYSEGLQVSPMEAMASGCVVFCHHWDGANELVPEEYIYYSDNELITKILEYRSLPDHIKRQKMDELRSMVSERFDVNNTKIQIRKLIESVGVKYQKQGHSG